MRSATGPPVIACPRAVRAVSRHRRDVVHVLPACAAAACPRARRRAAARLHRDGAVARRRRVHCRGHCRSGAGPSINAMAATTVNDFYTKYVRPDADEPTLLQVSRTWTIVWGVVQIGVAIGAQWMRRSVLEAGLAVLSWASGPVLGAFLLPARRRMQWPRNMNITRRTLWYDVTSVPP
jgi:hypothetical protein